MDMVSEPALSAWRAGLAMRDTEFGSILQDARSGDVLGRDINLHEGRRMSDRLHGWELSYDPALHRTQAAIQAASLMGELPIDSISEWLDWVSRACEAVQRIASKCWAGTPAEVRTNFIDKDDAWPGASSGTFAHLRLDVQGRLALKFAGLDSPLFRAALSDLAASARATPEAQGARAAAQAILKSPRLSRQLRAARAELRNRFPADSRLTIKEAFDATLEACATAYRARPDLQDLVDSLRTYNKLVTRIICVMLGVAEQTRPVQLTRSVGPVVDQIVGSSRGLHLTAADELLYDLRPTHPVMIKFGSPIDGLYLVEGYTMSFSGREEADLHLSAFDPLAG